MILWEIYRLSMLSSYNSHAHLHVCSRLCYGDHKKPYIHLDMYVYCSYHIVHDYDQIVHGSYVIECSSYDIVWTLACPV